MTKQRWYGGEFYLPPENWTLRCLFLSTLEALEPEIKQECSVGVVESLRRNVLPYYEKEQRHDERLAKDKSPITIDEAVSYYRHDPDRLTEYGRALIGWLIHWNLQADWLLDVATGTLRDWAGEEPRPGLVYLQPPSFAPPQNIELEKRFSAPDLLQYISPGLGFEYDPFAMRRHDVKERFESWKGEVEKRFKAFLDAQDKEAIARGGESTVEVRQHNHFEWLVRWQVQGWSRKRLEKHYHRAWRTIDDGITDTAKLVGLSRVSKKPGRPSNNCQKKCTDSVS